MNVVSFTSCLNGFSSWQHVKCMIIHLATLSAEHFMYRLRQRFNRGLPQSPLILLFIFYSVLCGFETENLIDFSGTRSNEAIPSRGMYRIRQRCDKVSAGNSFNYSQMAAAQPRRINVKSEPKFYNFFYIFKVTGCCFWAG